MTAGPWSAPTPRSPASSATATGSPASDLGRSDQRAGGHQRRRHLGRHIAQLAGVELPILPRRGFVLVTEPLPLTIHHKVYAGEYVANVLSSDEGLQTSPVIEGTASGTVLIGSSRERVGFDRTVSLPVLSATGGQGGRPVPDAAPVKVMRSYLGFRPYCPDHLPVIGPDPRAPGLWHASGHEGAGIGLSAGTAKLLTQALTGQAVDLDLTPFAPERFETTP